MMLFDDKDRAYENKRKDGVYRRLTIDNKNTVRRIALL